MVKVGQRTLLFVLAWSSVSIGVFAPCGCSSSETQHSLSSLLDEMSTVDQLGENLDWRCYTASSYDRSGGNEDKGQFERILPNGRKLILDAKGPGCVQRVWGTGMSDDDRLLFFFDGAKDPQLDVSFRELVYWQQRFPFVSPFRPDGSGVTYFPLAFQKSLRIEAKGPKPIYYQVTWRKFPRGTEVETYPGAFTPQQTSMVMNAGARWKAGKDLPKMAGLEWYNRELSIPVGGEAAVAIPGRGVIRNFTVELALPANEGVMQRNVTMRRTQLKMTWDGSEGPSVIVPVGPFFCQSWRESEFRSQPMSASNGVWTCRFPMPFRNGASVELLNGGGYPLFAKVRVGVLRVPMADEDIRYFHASWSVSEATGGEKRPHTILDVEGDGHYVGCSLSVESRHQSWLILEGDETIRVDGEKKPSHLGTGLEDYFNDCWYYVHGLRDHAWHGLLEFVPYRSHQYRFHNVDAIPFRKSFDMRFERGQGGQIPARMESVAYWYADKPQEASPFVPYTVDCRACGMAEGEMMAALISLERAKRYRDAARLTRGFIEQHPDSPFRDAILAREALYRDLAGEELLANDSGALGLTSSSPTAAVARSVAGLKGLATRALVGFQSATKGRLYLDGELIADAPNHFDYVGKIVELSPGPHMLSIEVEPSGHERWLLATVGSPWLVRGGVDDAGFYKTGWHGYLAKPAGWPEPEREPAATSVKMWPGTAGLPRPPYIAFRPNMLAGMQSGDLMIIGGDPGQMTKRVYLTKTFEWPGELPPQ